MKRGSNIPETRNIRGFGFWYHLFATSSLLFSKSPLLPLSSIAFDTIFSFRFAVERNERTNHSNRSSSHIRLYIIVIFDIRWKRFEYGKLNGKNKKHLN